MAKPKIQIDFPETIAQEIDSISSAITKLRHGKLNDRALVLLIHDVSGVGKPAIRDVLKACENLSDYYLNKAKEKGESNVKKGN